MKRDIIGKNGKPIGVTPSIILINPKFDHNVGQTIRAASCFGTEQVWFTGNRIQLDGKKCLPREERMKGYAEVDLIQFDYPFDQFKNATPVAIELTSSSELLVDFEHPDNAVYVFGPEDGSIPKVSMKHCHRFVSIPTRHCTNLSAAIYLVLYDRMLKRHQSGIEPILHMDDVFKEDRGYYDYKSEAIL